MNESFVGCTLKVRGVTYGIGGFSKLKRVQLYRMRGAHTEPVAGFYSDEDAARFVEWLRSIADALNPTPTLTDEERGSLITRTVRDAVDAYPQFAKWSGGQRTALISHLRDALITRLGR